MKGSRARRAGLLIAACVVVAGAWLLVPGPPRTATLDDERVATSSAPDDSLVELTTSHARIAAQAPASPQRAVEERAPVAIDLHTPGKSAKPVARVSSGKLTVRAVDAATREPIDHLRVRTASAERIADRNVGPGVTHIAFTLTPDTYTSVVLVPGYEPVELEPVRVVDGAEIALTAAMHRGTGRITGVVIDGGIAVHAELAGAGRRPCDRCAVSPATDASSGEHALARNKAWTRRDPCAHCGFAADFTRIPVESTSTFAFTNLASGPYVLRLTDLRGQSDGASLSIVLIEAQHVHVEMTAPLLRDVLVNLIDVDQVPLADAWGANVRAGARFGRARAVSSGSETPARELAWQVAVFADSEFHARGEFLTPTRPNYSDRRPAPFGGRKVGTGRTLDDRTRGADEDLRPNVSLPKFPESVFTSIVREDGLVQIGGLPTRELTIRLKCEPFTARVTVAESSQIGTVHAQLERPAELHAVDTSEPTTFRALDAARYH